MSGYFGIRFLHKKTIPQPFPTEGFATVEIQLIILAGKAEIIFHRDPITVII